MGEDIVVAMGNWPQLTGRAAGGKPWRGPGPASAGIGPGRVVRVVTYGRFAIAKLIILWPPS
jgi:hypothetical protein